MAKKHADEASAKLRNSDLVVLALFAIEGDRSPVHIEHIAHKVSQLAPGRFNWRHYPEQIDIERVRVRLSENKKPENGRRVDGGGRDGWWLTAAGVKWAKSATKAFAPVHQARAPIDRSVDRRRNLETDRIQSLPAWQKYHAVPIETATTSEAEAVFRIDEYVEGARRRHLVDRTLSLFTAEPEFYEFVQGMADLALSESGADHGN